MTDIIKRIWIIRIITLLACTLLPVLYGYATSTPINLTDGETVLILMGIVTVWYFVAPTLAAGLDPYAGFTWFNHTEWHAQKARIAALKETLERHGSRLEIIDPRIYAHCRETIDHASYIINHGFILNRIGEIIFTSETEYVHIITDIDNYVPKALAYFTDKPQPSLEQLNAYFGTSVKTIPERRGFFAFLLTTAYLKADELNLRAA